MRKNNYEYERIYVPIPSRLHDGLVAREVGGFSIRPAFVSAL